ncbi:hypothetical protein KIN20_004220 [Parelaphostrongylus tenuis]|uniref:Uncharacterized protein n=1 Tax=Parelaphostrongylus tenuis TaxID=148309 RepID=A0AAD5MR07_PARTN|nr:hypothetical protein KIN20_004220 [Parelaphostrongylus tenuis]
MKDKRIIVVKEDSRSNLYFAPSVTASSGAELSANTPVLIPTSVIPHGITLDTSDSSYATAERRVNVGVTPVVTNPHANPSVVPQIRSYCAGQQTALPYAVANPYVLYSPNASSFPTDPQSVGHPYIGYIPGVVPNPYGQQSSMAPTKGGDRDLRSL